MTRIGTQQEYEELADLAEQTGEDFVRLAERFEEGEEISAIRESIMPPPPVEAADPDWLFSGEVKKIIPGLLDAVRRSGIEPRRKNPTGKRNAGRAAWLWHREDIRDIAAIARVCRLQSSQALRVFGALRSGNIRATAVFETGESAGNKPSFGNAQKDKTQPHEPAHVSRQG